MMSFIAENEQTLVFTQDNGEVILSVLKNGAVVIRDGQETRIFTDEGRPCFSNEETGEKIIEYMGLAVDGRSDCSWAKAFLRKADGSSLLHFHKEREEAYYIVRGKAKIVIDDVVHVLEGGEKITIKPQQKHQVFNLSDQEALEFIVKCSPAWIPEDHHCI